MNQELVNCCGNCSHVTIINCGMRPLCRKSEMEADYHCEVDGKAHSVFDSCDNFEARIRCYIKGKEDKCPNVYSLFGTDILFDSRSETCPAMYVGDGKQFRMIAKFDDAEDMRMVERLLARAVMANIEAYHSGYEDGKDAGYTEGLKEGRRR